MHPKGILVPSEDGESMDMTVSVLWFSLLSHNFLAFRFVFPGLSVSSFSFFFRAFPIFWNLFISLI